MQRGSWWKTWVLVLVLGVGMVSGFVACETQSTYQKSYQVLSVTKETAVFLGQTAKEWHAQGLLSDEKLQRIREAYTTMQQVQATLIDAQITAIDSGDQATEAQVKTLISTYLQASTKFVTIAIELGLIKDGDARIVIH